MTTKLAPLLASALFISILAINLVSSAHAQADLPDEPLQVTSLLGASEKFFAVEGKRYSGFYVDLWDAIAVELGLSYEWVPIEPYSALLESVGKAEVDVAAFHISVTKEREQVMDFTHVVFEDGYQLYLPANGSNRPNIWAIVIDSSLPSVLGITALVLFVIANIVWLVERRRADSDFNPRYLLGIEDAFWWSVVTVTTVGYGDKTPKGRLGRIIGIILMILSLFIASLFVGEITAALTSIRLESSINSVDDLRGHRVGVLEDSVFEDYVIDAGIRPIRYTTEGELMEALARTEIDAAIDARITGLSLPDSIAQQVRMVGGPFRADNIALALPQDSPKHRALIEQINQALLTLREDGTYDVIYASWFGDGK